LRLQGLHGLRGVSALSSVSGLESRRRFRLQRTRMRNSVFSKSVSAGGGFDCNMSCVETSRVGSVSAGRRFDCNTNGGQGVGAWDCVPSPRGDGFDCSMLVVESSPSRAPSNEGALFPSLRLQLRHSAPRRSRVRPPAERLRLQRSHRPQCSLLLLVSAPLRSGCDYNYRTDSYTNLIRKSSTVASDSGFRSSAERLRLQLIGFHRRGRTPHVSALLRGGCGYNVTVTGRISSARSALLRGGCDYNATERSRNGWVFPPSCGAVAITTCTLSRPRGYEVRLRGRRFRLQPDVGCSVRVRLSRRRFRLQFRWLSLIGFSCSVSEEAVSIATPLTSAPYDGSVPSPRRRFRLQPPPTSCRCRPVEGRFRL